MKVKSDAHASKQKQYGKNNGSRNWQASGADDDEVGEPAISLHDAYATLDHDREMQRAIVRIPFPIVYFALFVAMLFTHLPATSLFELGYSVSSTLASSGTDTVTADSTMKFTNIQTIGDTFDWLTDTFVPSVFVTEDYNGVTLAKDKWGRVAMFNKVLGAVHFERVLAKIHPCSAAQFLVDLYPNCYDPAKVTTESVLISFDTNATEATEVINQLKAKGTWLDFATQSLTITIVTYNGELQGYAVTELKLEFHQGGFIEASSSTTPALSDPYQQTTPIVLDVLVGLCFLAALATQILASTRHRRDPKFFTSIWTLIEHASSGVVVAFYVIWISIVAFMYQHSFRDNLARLVVSGKTFDADSDERNGLIAVTKSLQRIARLTTALRLIALFAVFLLGMRIIERFRFHPRLSILTRAIGSALDQFRWFFVVFVVIYITFAISGTVLFGDRVQGFSSLRISMETCINMLFGNFDYTTIQTLYSPMAMIYYWGYMIVVSLVLLNMMLAIVLDAYAEVSSETFKLAKNMSLTRALRNIAWDLMETFYTRKNPVCKTNDAARPRTRDLSVLNRKAAASTEIDGVSIELREWSHDEVVFRGMIRPHVLVEVVEGVLKSQPAAKASRIPTFATKLLLTKQTLKDLFAGAEIKDDEAQNTIRFIREGMRELPKRSGVRREDSGDAASDPKDNPLIRTRSPSKPDKKDDGELRDPAESNRVTETAESDHEEHLKKLVAQVEAMEKKLDRLLYKTSLE